MFHKIKDKNLRRGPCPPNPPRFSTIPMSSSPPAFTWVVTIIRTSFERIYPKEDDDLPLFHLVDDCAQPLPSCWFCWDCSSSAARVPTRRDCLANICCCCLLCLSTEFHQHFHSLSAWTPSMFLLTSLLCHHNAPGVMSLFSSKMFEFSRQMFWAFFRSFKRICLITVL